MDPVGDAKNAKSMENLTGQKTFFMIKQCQTWHYSNFGEISGIFCVVIMAARLSTPSATSESDVDDHDADVLMANDTITVCINECHKTIVLPNLKTWKTGF